MAEASTLVFGATGALGRHVLDALAARGISPETITAAGRNQVRLGELAAAGFGTAAVDLSDSAAVEELVARHSDIVLISGGDPNRLAQHESVIKAAKNANARHAEALAIVVTTAGHDNVTYSLSGDTDFTYADIAEAMSVVLEREVAYQPVTAEELRGALINSGMGGGLAAFLAGLDETIAAGVFARVGDDLSRLLGRPTTGLVEGLTAK
ncbi:NAD(P)H-binding protein [Amycolatopsis sp. NBC_00345]|uniref:NAD(P)H-binding protein n=1 Tax=Amycolatopsis sp. NBC_00345 TaxID=2975955 RepID=UPI002E26D766